LSNTQADSEPSPDHDIGEDITTLEDGLSALRAVYDEFDVGIRELRERSFGCYSSFADLDGDLSDIPKVG